MHRRRNRPSLARRNWPRPYRRTHGQRLARFEPHQLGRWLEVARSKEAVLPDARPLQVDLDGRGDGGHIAELAGPDGTRCDHVVLGNSI